MIDERIAEFKHLITLKKVDNLLLIGDLPPAMLNIIAQISEKIHLVTTSAENREILNSTHGVMKEANISVLPAFSTYGTLQLADQSMDLVILMGESIGITALLPKLERILKPEGKLIIFYSKNGIFSRMIQYFILKDRKTFENTFSRQKDIVNVLKNNNYFNDIKKYAFVPSPKEVRWIIPLWSGKLTANSLTIYKPSLLSAKLKKKAAALLSRIGLTDLWTPYRIIIAKHRIALKEPEQKDLLSLMKQIFRRDDIEIALFTGTPGYYRKSTTQVMSSKGEILAFTKIAENPHAAALIENEANMLIKLKSLKLKNARVPEVLYFVKQDDRTILVQSTIKNFSLSSPHRLKNIHIEFLAEIFNKTAKCQIFKESNCFLELQQRIGELQGRVPDDWISRLKDAICIIVDNIGDTEIPLCLCHRDFVPWNIIIDQGKLFVIDWEFAHEGYLPFYDLFHFISQKETIARQRFKIPDLLNSLLTQDKQLNTLYSKYNKLIKLEENMLTPFLLFYLCDVTTFYLHGAERQSKSLLNHRAVSVKREMLNTLLKNIRI